MSERQVVDAIAGAPLRVAYLGFSPGFAYVKGFPTHLPASSGERRRGPRFLRDRWPLQAGTSASTHGRARGDGISSAAPTSCCSIRSSRLTPPSSPETASDSCPPRRSANLPPLHEIRRRPRCSSSHRSSWKSRDCLTTLQDGGRINVGHLGVPSAGAADSESMRLANLIAGNPELSGGLETTLEGPVLRFDTAAHAVVVGAGVALDGRSVPSRRGRRGSRRGATQGRAVLRPARVRGSVRRDPGPRAVRELLVGPAVRARVRDLSRPGTSSRSATQDARVGTPASCREAPRSGSCRARTCRRESLAAWADEPFVVRPGQQPDRSQARDGSRSGRAP